MEILPSQNIFRDRFKRKMFADNCRTLKEKISRIILCDKCAHWKRKSRVKIHCCGCDSHLKFNKSLQIIFRFDTTMISQISLGRFPFDNGQTCNSFSSFFVYLRTLLRHHNYNPRLYNCEWDSMSYELEVFSLVRFFYISNKFKARWFNDWIWSAFLFYRSAVCLNSLIFLLEMEDESKWERFYFIYM